MVHRIALALQGGGSHGAFTWGVLHRLLDEVAQEQLAIAALSGSSAGAINGALCAYGLNGNEARAASSTQDLLAQFWTSVSARALLDGNPFSGGAQAGPWSGWNADWSPAAIALEALSLVLSPYSFPFYTNPLESLLREALPASAIAAINGPAAPHLHVCAVNVDNNRRKLFARPELSIESLLASACLPQQFRAIGIGQHFYWDGGYIGNPALAPLVKSCTDIIVVMLNPMHTLGTLPRSARQILDRLNDIGLNTPLVLEVNSIHAVNKLLMKLPPEQAAASGYHRVHLHFISNEKLLAPLGFVSKNNASPAFLSWLFEEGKKTASHWWRDNAQRIGVASSCSWDGDFDLERDFIDAHLKSH